MNFDGNIKITRKKIEKNLNAFSTCKGWKLSFENITVIIIFTRSTDLKKRSKLEPYFPRYCIFFPLGAFARIRVSLGKAENLYPHSYAAAREWACSRRGLTFTGYTEGTKGGSILSLSFIVSLNAAFKFRASPSS